MRPRVTPVIALVSAGAAAMVTAFLDYITRYSMFDSRQGEIGTVLYGQITSMTGFEKTVLILGLLAIASGGLLGTYDFLMLRRRHQSARS